MANEHTFHFVIQSPDGKKFEDDASILNLRLSDGAFGLLKGRRPVIGVIDICHMDYVDSSGQRKYFALSGGILDVKKDYTLILADSFESKDEIDETRAKEAKERAEALLNKAVDPAFEGKNNIDVKRAELALRRAVNRLTLLDLK